MTHDAGGSADASTKAPRWGWLEWALVVAVLALGVQLGWPVWRRWQNRPRPGVQVAGSFGPFGYLLYLPRAYNATKKWPLLVYLHGGRSRGNDPNYLRGRDGPPAQIERGMQLPMIVLSPRCPPGSWWVPAEVLGLIDHVASRFAVDKRRITLTGDSMGGCGTWDTAAAAPERFAAIVPVSARGDPKSAKRLTDLPVWAFHGRQDDVIPWDQGQAIVDAVLAAGGSAKMTAYPHAGHNVCGRTYTNHALYDWILAQKRGG